MFGAGSIINKQQVRDASAKKCECSYFGWFMGQCFSKLVIISVQNKKFPSEVADTVQTSTPTNDAVSTAVNLVATNMDKQNLVPQKFEGFVSWGHHNTIKQIVKSGLFYPVFVTDCLVMVRL